MTGRRAKIGFGILAGIGLSLFLAAAVIELSGVILDRPYEVPHSVFFAAIVLGFVGFSGLDPVRTERGTGFLVRSGVTILNALPRFGRRSTDAIAVPKVETKTTAEPPGVADEDKG